MSISRKRSRINKRGKKKAGVESEDKAADTKIGESQDEGRVSKRKTATESIYPALIPFSVFFIPGIVFFVSLCSLHLVALC